MNPFLFSLHRFRCCPFRHHQSHRCCIGGGSSHDCVDGGNGGRSRLVRLVGTNAVVAGLEVAASVAFTFVPPMMLKGGFGESQMSVVFGIGKIDLQGVHKVLTDYIYGMPKGMKMAKVPY
jgi:hypothetical protein